MKQLFADTSYWIALVNPRDQIHEKAISVSKQLRSVTLVTTEMVLAELLNGFGNSPFRGAVGGMVANLRRDQTLKIVPQTPGQFESALRRYQQAHDKSWSLTDCATFEVMDVEGIEAALTYDRHFAQAGFKVLLR